MNYAFAAVVALCSLGFIACNESGLDNAPRGTFSQLACLDTNRDNRLSAEDGAKAESLPDFNADGDRDAFDAAFLYGVDIALDPARDTSTCDDSGRKTHEYLVAHGLFTSSDVSCDDGDEAVLLIGVGGGVVDLKNDQQAAGVRQVVDALQKAYDDRDVQTIGVISGQAIGGAQNPHTAMEDWLTHSVIVYLNRFPCLRVAMVGHSHGAIMVTVVAARLEAQYADRLIAVVPLDRVAEDLYIGDLQSRPQQIPIFNVYQTNEAGLSGGPIDGANVENWDASGVQVPAEGGDTVGVTHTKIDNAKEVRDRIVEEVMERS